MSSSFLSRKIHTFNEVMYMMFIQNINKLIDEMLEDKTGKKIWFGLLIFGIASTWLAWQFVPLTIFEAILDPIAVSLMIAKTMDYYKNKANK